MYNNNTTLDRTTKKRLARPLKILVPIIKQDLIEMKVAAEEASVPYQIKIGGELIEAKADPKLAVKAVFDDWVWKTFRIKPSTAWYWINSARRHDRGEIEFESGHTASKTVYGDDREAHHRPKWNTPVKGLIDRARTAAHQFATRRLTQAKERDAERRLALRLIDIGYKILSVELHPDRSGGSHEAMQRLNAVRARLKDAA